MPDDTDPRTDVTGATTDETVGPVGGERWAMGVLAVNVVAVPALAIVGIAGGVSSVDLLGLLAAVVLVVGLSMIQMSVISNARAESG